jgi:hypothetical protein
MSLQNEKNRLVWAIRECSKAVGVPPQEVGVVTYRKLKTNYYYEWPSAENIIKAYGSWAAARTQAGIDQKKISDQIKGREIVPLRDSLLSPRLMRLQSLHL